MRHQEEQGRFLAVVAAIGRATVVRVVVRIVVTDLPMPSERERRYLNHAELLQLANATERFETLTLVLGYCGLRFGEAAALRRKHVGDREPTVRSSATYVTGRGIVETTSKTNRARHVPVPGPVWGGCRASCRTIRTHLCFQAMAAATYLSRSTGEHSIRHAEPRELRGWYRAD
jgi:integrase